MARSACRLFALRSVGWFRTPSGSSFILFYSLILIMADGAGTFAHVSETGRVPLHSTSGTHSNSRGASEELDTHGTFVRPAAERGTSI